jgi:hypothetical protein
MAKNSKATKLSVLLREAVTLATPRGRLIVFVPVLLLLAAIPVPFLEQTLPQLSICHALLGEHCYSVGITRGVSSILHGAFVQAWSYNPLAFPVLAVLLSIALLDTWRLRRH